MALVVIVFVGAVLLFGAVWIEVLNPSLRWLIIAGLIVVFLMLIGRGINRRLDGVLIDTRFKISLSRLQMTLWTVLVLSAFLTIALPRSLPNWLHDLATVDEQTREELLKLSPEMAACFPDPADQEEGAVLPEECEPDPLRITFPTELVAALGISAASFAGSTLVQSVKKGKKVKTTEVQLLEVKLRQARQEGKGVEAEVTEAQRALEGSSLAASVLRQQQAQQKKDAAETKRTEAQQNRDAAATKLAEAQAKLEQAAPEERDAVQQEVAQAQSELEQAQGALDQAQSELEQAQSELKQATAQLSADREKQEEIDRNLNEARANLSRSQERQAQLTGELEQARVKTMEEAQGLLHRNTDASQASWGDLFRGDELGNYQIVDLSKVQMFFFTIVVIFAYAMAVHGLLQNELLLRHPLGVDFPSFSATLNALLGISHAGYLTVKSVDHTKEEPKAS